MTLETTFWICGVIMWVCSLFMFYMAIDTYKASKKALEALSDLFCEAKKEAEKK